MWQQKEFDVEIYRDKIIVSGNGNLETFIPSSAFSTQRLLVGNFGIAQDCLRSAIKKMGFLNFFNFGLRLRIHPKECIEGGLSEIELRILKELGHGAGAKRVDVILDGKVL